MSTTSSRSSHGCSAARTGSPSTTCPTPTGATAGSDRVTVNGLAGDDVLDASATTTGSVLLPLEGAARDDVLLGGAGDDVLLGGTGTDVLDGGTGGNVVIQSLGADAVTAASVAGRSRLAAHAGTVDGRTVLQAAGRRWTLPRADLTQLTRDAPPV